jgi:hypothetical protein
MRVFKNKTLCEGACSAAVTVSPATMSFDTQHIVDGYVVPDWITRLVNIDEGIAKYILNNTAPSDKSCLLFSGKSLCYHYIRNRKDCTLNMQLAMWQFANPSLQREPGTVFRTSCRDVKCIHPEHLKCMKQDEAKLDDLFSKTIARPETGCFLWQGIVNLAGYGVSSYKNVDRLAHRLVYMLSHPSEDIKGLMICHTCPLLAGDDPRARRRCINPSHLESGDAARNGTDMAKDGTRNGKCAKISATTAQAIIDSKRPRDHPEFESQTKRAKRFGVGFSTVCSIDKGGTWAHLSGQTAKHNERQLKARHWAIKKRAIPLTEEQKQELLERIRENTVETPSDKLPTPCRIWARPLPAKTYPTLSMDGKTFQCHAFVCEYHHGNIPKGQVARHLCGNDTCCGEPSHLAPGTRRDNALDSMKHNTHVSSKLTEQQVIEIKQLLQSDSRLPNCRKISSLYGVTALSIFRIGNGLRWSHVQSPSDSNSMDTSPEA